MTRRKPIARTCVLVSECTARMEVRGGRTKESAMMVLSPAAIAEVSCDLRDEMRGWDARTGAAVECFRERCMFRFGDFVDVDDDRA